MAQADSVVGAEAGVPVLAHVPAPDVPVPVPVVAVRNFMETDLRRLPEAGIYKYDIVDENQKSRLHLRVDEGGSGLLLINASKIIYLNQTAMAMAYLYLNKVEKEEALDFLTDLFDVPEETLKTDFEITTEKIEALID